MLLDWLLKIEKGNISYGIEIMLLTLPDDSNVQWDVRQGGLICL